MRPTDLSDVEKRVLRYLDRKLSEGSDGVGMFLPPCDIQSENDLTSEEYAQVAKRFKDLGYLQDREPGLGHSSDEIFVANAVLDAVRDIDARSAPTWSRAFRKTLRRLDPAQVWNGFIANFLWWCTYAVGGLVLILVSQMFVSTSTRPVSKIDTTSGTPTTTTAITNQPKTLERDVLDKSRRKEETNSEEAGHKTFTLPITSPNRNPGLPKTRKTVSLSQLCETIRQSQNETLTNMQRNHFGHVLEDMILEGEGIVEDNEFGLSLRVPVAPKDFDSYTIHCEDMLGQGLMPRQRIASVGGSSMPSGRFPAARPSRTRRSGVLASSTCGRFPTTSR